MIMYLLITFILEIRKTGTTNANVEITHILTIINPVKFFTYFPVFFQSLFL